MQRLPPKAEMGLVALKSPPTDLYNLHPSFVMKHFMSKVVGGEA